jgi:putative nucleotidyltransferase with HDIG domain
MLADGIAASGYQGIVLDRLAKQAVQILAADDSCIFVRDHSDPDMDIVAAASGVDESIVGKRVPVDVEQSRARHGALVELCWRGDVQGTLAVRSMDDDSRAALTTPDLLDALAPTVAAAIWHAHTRLASHPDVRRNIAGLVAALAERDGYTASHSMEIVSTARTLGIAMGLDTAGLAELEAAALLHDIGKIIVPDTILKKRGPLTPSEHTIMAQHPARGAEILARVPGLEAVATIVRYHHERWDGGGYPDGLAGARIPLASRIISVCDSFSAMTSDRPYRRATSRSRALTELEENAGRQFDPDVTLGALEIFERAEAA